MDARDERFIEEAIAAGVLEPGLAERLRAARRAAPTGEPIEAYAIRARVMTRDAVDRAIAHARSRERMTEPARPAVADSANELFIDSDVGPAQLMNLPSVRPRTTPDPTASRAKALGRLPDRFGDFEILGEIARGGMGVVYRARSAARPEPVALKVLLAGAGASPEQIRRFEREIKAGLLLDHPNVVKVFDGGAIDDKLYFTMELVSGDSLDKLLPSLSLREKVSVMEKVSRAVHHAHEKGYIHRDLKPQNILVGADMEPKVADFGLARSIDTHSRLTKTGALVGTPYYMSPEQARGEHDALDRRTDVYSLGAVLYQAIAGQLPFTADSALGLIGQILNDEPKDPCALSPECPKELAAVALRALEKEPDARYPTALGIAEELSSWLEGRRISTVAQSPVARVIRRAKKARRTILIVAAAAVIAGLPTAYLGWKIVTARRAARETARARLEQDVTDAAAAAVHQADAVLAGRQRSGGADDDQALRDALAALERVEASVHDSDYDESKETLAKVLETSGVTARRRELEAIVLLQEASAVREDGLDALAARIVKAREANPGREDLSLALATALARKGAAEDAVAALASTALPACLELKGAIDLELEDLAGAAEAYRGALDADPRSKPARRGLARALFLAHDPAALAALADDRSPETRALTAEATSVTDPGLGVDLFRRAEREKLADPEIARRLGELLLRLERPEEARLALDRAAELTPRDARIPLARASAWLEGGDAKHAAEDAAAAGELARPGTLLRARARAREATIHALAAPGSDPRSAALLLAAFAERKNDLELELAGIEIAGEPALMDLDRIARGLGRRAAAARAWSLLALQAAASNDAARAGAAARQALSIAPADERALFVLGELGGLDEKRAAHAAFAAGWSDAARFLRASIVRDRLAQRFRRKEDQDAAELLLAFAEKAAPWSAAPALERARRTEREGHKDAAISLLEKDLPVAGGDPDGNALLALLLLDKDEKANAPRAEELAARAIALAPKHARALTARARARLALGRSEEALADLDASLASDHRAADTWALKVKAFEALGRTDGLEALRLEASERAHAGARAAKYQQKGDDATLNALPDYTSGVDYYRRAIDLEPSSRGLASSRLGGHLLIGFANYPDEPVYRLSQAAFWDPAHTMPEGDTLKSLSLASDLGAAAARFEQKWHETHDIEDLWLAAYTREIVVEGGKETPETITAARLTCERVISADPTVITAYIYRGFARGLLRQSDLAEQDEGVALRYFNDSCFAYFALAVAEAGAGHKEKALEAFTKAKEIEGSIVERARRYESLQAIIDESSPVPRKPR